MLQNVPVHNLSEERIVGLLNYELDFRGWQNFGKTSQNLVQNKAKDLIDSSFKYKDISKFRKQAQDIRDLKLKWNEKM